MDFRANDLPDESVQMVVTSPPYWGLRKYSGEQDLIWGGDKDCEHQWIEHHDIAEGYTGTLRWVHGDTGRAFQKDGQTHAKNRRDNPEAWSKDIRRYGFCSLCGAWRGAYGLEPTPEMYVQHTIEILREIRRVLRKDGVVFWNIGDSYGSGKGTCFNPGGGKGSFSGHGDRKDAGAYPLDRGNISMLKASGLKPKDLCLIPFRVAIAAQDDGWWVRSVIIWSKPNPMPESVTDRPTESHEYILMLTKNKTYYWGQEAVREVANYDGRHDTIMKSSGKYSRRSIRPEGIKPEGAHTRGAERWPNQTESGERGRNLRSVWSFPTQPYPEAHFAVFPEKLPELCIKAASKPDDIVLDPFAGAGTTLWVAKKLNRRSIGFDISEEYCKLAVDRIRQQVML